MPAFLDELLEAHKSRNELMKWKLIVVSALGAAGLGLMKSSDALNLHFIILIIPITCVYIDVLCRNLSVRRKRIIFFITTLKENELTDADIKFAQFYKIVKEESGRSLESFAVIWSTVIISFLIAVIGFWLEKTLIIKLLFVLSGFLGAFLSWFVEKRYQFEKSAVEKAFKIKT